MLAYISKCKARAVIVVPNTRASWFPIIERGSRSPFSTNCIPGRGQPVPEGTPPTRSRTVHVRPRRHASGRGGFQGRHIIYTRTTTHPVGIHNTRALINERIYAHHDQSPPNQYMRRTSTTVTRPNQYTITTLTPWTLIRVSDTRGRVLYSKCHGENDDAFHFCQWCTAPSTYGSRGSDTALLCIDEYAIEQ